MSSGSTSLASSRAAAGESTVRRMRPRCWDSSRARSARGCTSSASPGRRARRRLRADRTRHVAFARRERGETPTPSGGLAATTCTIQVARDNARHPRPVWRGRALRLGVCCAGRAADPPRADAGWRRCPVRRRPHEPCAGHRRRDDRHPRCRRALVRPGTVPGTRALGALCRFSLDPDSLIREAKDRFLAHRMRYVVLAKFLPGVNPLAAGLAGIVSIRPERFLRYAAAGALLWAGAWITLGYLCADLVAVVVARAAPVGRPLAVCLGATLALYLGWKYIRRHRFLRHLAAARIAPLELKRRLDAGDPLVIVDLRTALDTAVAPYTIPGARLIDPQELQHPHHTIPRDSEVVFYCAEPREATSARVALRAAAIGFKIVRPLSGGLEGWREAGLPVEPLARR